MNLRKILYSILLIFPLAFSSCRDSGDEPIAPAEKERLILLYAVAANNLQYNLADDLSEILTVADKLNLENNIVLVYYVRQDGVCKLSRLGKDESGNYNFIEEARFPDTPLSTSQERINEVCLYVGANYDYPYKGLIMWSHGTGWLYWPDGSTPEAPKRGAFGEDKYDGGTYKTNIPELAEGIPNGMFDFIWFDCCYAANIETLYQLREKTDYIVGPVIEISDGGMPYQLTMPYLLQKNSDLEGAATAFCDYYENLKYYNYNFPYALSIVRTDMLSNLATVAKEIMTVGETPEFFGDIQNYSILKQNGIRTTFYDLEQLLDSYLPSNSDLPDRLHSCLSETVIFNRISSRNWPLVGGEAINVDKCSGLSMHHFIDLQNASSEFYKTLDWYKVTH